MQINFFSSLDAREIRIMESKSDNIEIMMGSETDDIIKELFKSFLQRHQEHLEKKWEQAGFVFQSVDLLHYSLTKTTLRRGKSCIKPPE